MSLDLFFDVLAYVLAHDLTRYLVGAGGIYLVVNLGLAGLLGSGRTESAELMFGVTPAQTGTARDRSGDSGASSFPCCRQPPSSCWS